MPALETVLVTGGTGFIGRHLVARLLERAVAVRLLTRRPEALPREWKGKVVAIAGDLADRGSLKSAVAGCAVVCHSAGEIRDPARMQATNVEGTRLLLEACETAAVRHVIHLSSVGVMGARRAGPVDERKPCRPASEYERSKYEAERLAVAWSERSGVPLAVLRPTNVFGDGPRGGRDSMREWLAAIQSGRFVLFDRRAAANYVYVGDVTDACLRVLERRAAGVYIVADPCSLADFVEAAAEALGVRCRPMRVPRAVGFGAAVLLQGVASLTGRRSSLTVSRVCALSSRTVYLGRKLADDLGWRPQVGYAEGLRRTVNWYRRAGALR